MRLQVKLWAEVFGSVIEDTKGYVEKKQASTYEEIVAEQEQKAEEVHNLLSYFLQSQQTQQIPFISLCLLICTSE